MEQNPDSNDIGLETYSIDLLSIVEWILETVLGLDYDTLIDMFAFWWAIYSVIAILLSILFFAGFIYAKIRYGQLAEIEMEKIKNDELEWARQHGYGESKNTQWSEIQRHVASKNPSDWRLAIIEADIMLEETLNSFGYVGSTIGEKLKSANPSSFKTLQDAWEAHKVRNEIAHAGSDFVLTQKAATETIVRFERVFSEFGVV